MLDGPVSLSPQLGITFDGIEGDLGGLFNHAPGAVDADGGTPKDAEFRRTV